MPRKAWVWLVPCIITGTNNSKLFSVSEVRRRLKIKSRKSYSCAAWDKTGLSIAMLEKNLTSNEPH